ncbi:outer membrane receptor protein involved in Fe transport [Caulobacter ginsengisoli]|uniref:Outer membrane receptor protein involved in Fe transport n=1 Tax=Caulobacter ginsengisoli TaxID=400775 RepID=A0ABU0IY02_9CAUL|nr:TonB-dependent receptor [Caulobacter ginsengisoli]MDQ0466887.1 outer membrane receptor protein involved in Fe transport [Caulobacter ginsengisoli]
MNSKTTRRSALSRALLISVSGLAALAGGVGMARAAETDAEPTMLSDVIVTARKREENIQNIPVAVSALSGKQLERQSLKSIEDISASMPQLTVSRGSSGSGATISVRGIGSSSTSIGIEQSVAVIVDGVYYGQGRIINEGFFDMKQVEVLKGPQALFFGKNATAGVLSFTSAGPTGEFEAMGRLGYEFDSKTPSIEAVVSGPVTDTFGLRLAVRGSQMQGGYVQNQASAMPLSTLNVNTFASTLHVSPAPEKDIPGEQDFVARLTGQWNPNDAFSLTLKAAVDTYRVTDATWNDELISCPLGSAQVHPGEICNKDWKIQQNDVPKDIAATNPLLGRHGGQLYQDYDSYSFTANADYRAGPVTFSSVTGLHHFVNYFLGDYDFTGSANGGTWGTEKSEYRAFSEEIRFQTDLDGPFDFMGGVYYQNTQLDFHQQIIFPGALEDPTVTRPELRYITLEKLSRTDGTTFAGFGQVIWKIADGWELTAGGRYTHETKDSTFDQPYVISLYQGVFVPNSPLNANQSFNDLSPEVTLTWRPRSNLTLYAAYKRGFKSGGFSGSALHSINTTVDDLTFEPEKPQGFEGGVKATLFDGTLRASFDVFSYDYKDFQIDFFDATKIQYITTNAGSVKTEGAEFQAEWAPEFAHGLLISGSLSYNKSRYEDFGGAPCWGGQRPSQGCTIVGGRPVQDLSGKPTANAPEWTGSLQADYQSEPINGLVFGLSGNLHGSSDYLLSPFANPNGRQDAYTVFDASARLGGEDGRWEVALIGKNLTDEYVLTSAGDAPSSGSGTGTPLGIRSDLVGTPRPPRTIAIQFTLRR